MAADIGLSGGNVASVYLMATAQVGDTTHYRKCAFNNDFFFRVLLKLQPVLVLR